MPKRTHQGVFILMVILGGMSLTSLFNGSRFGVSAGPAYAAERESVPDVETGMICYNFEDGQFPAGTTLEGITRSPVSGRVEVTNRYPYQGQYAMDLDTNCGGTCTGSVFTRQAAIFHFDLTSGLDTILKFWVRNHNDEPDYDDGVFISAGGANPFVRIAPFPQGPQAMNAYSEVVLDLDQAAAQAGQPLTSDFQIKFQSYDNFSIPSDGFSIDSICVCQEPQAVINATATRSGNDYILSWNGSEGNLFEVWTAVNDLQFEPGDDCGNPGPYQCQIATSPGAVVSGLVEHPDFRYSFAIVARNGCGQRTQGVRVGRKSTMTYAFTALTSGDTAVTLAAPATQTFTASNYTTQPITYTATFTNNSAAYTSQNAVLTQTIPAMLQVDYARSTAGWQQVGSSSTYTLPLGSLAPGQGGTARLVAVVGSGLPALAQSTVVLGDQAGSDPNPTNNKSSAAVILAATPDSDGDNLPDWIETNTLVFAGGLAAGTNPNVADTDGDGIRDGDEVRGTAAGLDLPAMGANPLRKNILIEYDWFDDALECAPHSHRPRPAAAQKITDAFAAAPVANPDGSYGIDVIQDYGQGGPFTGGGLINDPDGVIAGGVFDTEYKNYKAAHFAANRLGYFHYVLLPHRYNTNSASSGQAEMPGDDAIVSLYCYGSDHNVAHTVMHELGHNLNLQHGGNDEFNQKPNYNSVMNYRYQFAGVDNNCTPPGDGVLSYSTGSRAPLNESNLNEAAGICGAVPWDWNGNGQIESGVSTDTNGDSLFSILNDHNDWANIRFLGTLGGNSPGNQPNQFNTFTPVTEVQIIEELPLPAWVIDQGPAGP